MDEKTTNPNGGSNGEINIVEGEVEEKMQKAGYNFTLRFAECVANNIKKIYSYSKRNFSQLIKDISNGIKMKLKAPEKESTKVKNTTAKSNKTTKSDEKANEK